jgi:hypothetical protein
MDADRWERLSRVFVTGASRRAMGLLLAGLALREGIDLAAAKHKHKKKRKKPAPPAPPPPVFCPPACPVCQTCNTTTGICEAQPRNNGLPGQECHAPRVCCSGACCDPVHACNRAGTCATCAEACLDTRCILCINTVDRGTVCAGDAGGHCDEPCTATAQCATGRVCALGWTDREVNATTFIAPLCSQPTGTAFCVTVTPCA